MNKIIYVVLYVISLLEEKIFDKIDSLTEAYCWYFSLFTLPLGFKNKQYLIFEGSYLAVSSANYSTVVTFHLLDIPLNCN